MSTDHSEIQLTPEQQVAIALHADREGKNWSELIEDRFPVLMELNEEEMQASLAMIDRGIAEVDAGGGHDAVEALKKLGAKHGFPLDE